MQGEIDMGNLALCEANPAAKEFATAITTDPIVKRRSEASRPRKRYDRLSRHLHWSVAIGIIFTLAVGYAMHAVTNETVHHVLSTLNMSVATVVMVLMMVRFVWRFFRPEVTHGEHMPFVQRAVADFAHEVFYLIIFCVLISGFLMLKHSFVFFGFVEIPRLIHEEAVNDFFFGMHRVSCIALVAMLLLHVAAVFKHQKIDKHPILTRMR